jgi:hypothetical protein
VSYLVLTSNGAQQQQPAGIHSRCLKQGCTLLGLIKEVISMAGSTPNRSKAAVLINMPLTCSDVAELIVTYLCVTLLYLYFYFTLLAKLTWPAISKVKLLLAG